MKPFIVILTGPTCAGKSTLEAKLRETGFASVVSTTTRPPRVGEVDGKNYHFVNETRFSALQEEGGMVESVTFGGYRYGVTKGEIDRHASAGAPVVVVCEPSGRNQIVNFCEQNGWAYHTVYVGNPDRVIAGRFLSRMLNDVEEVGLFPSLADPVVERYAQRMEQMVTTERAWVAEAYFQNQDGSRNEPYDRILWEFNEENDTAVVQSILDEFRVFKFERERLVA
jgi:guanylate kinase